MSLPEERVPEPEQGKAQEAREIARQHAEGGIKKQVSLPWSKAITIAFNSMKIRFWRSMVTGAGIFLGIAFLCYSATTYLLQHPPSDPALMGDYQHDHNRQIWLVIMALLVCTVGIMNSMLMSVSERFREIGTMKCLGALNSLIVRLFLIEAIFMGMTASFGGWLLGTVGIVLARIATMGVHDGMAGFTFVLFVKLFVGSIGIGAAITLVAALLPALRAAQMPPAAALRTEV